MKQYDVVIIGAGPGGLALAYPLKEAGLKVAVVEENLWGGTCPNRGCDPKKVLLAAVEAKMRNQYLIGNGIKNASEINWQALMQFEKTFTDPVSKSSRAGLVDAQIDVWDGHAEFIDQHTLKIDGESISSEKFVIATGQRPGRLTQIQNQELMETSTDFLKMEQLPNEIAFVGGGYIAFELAMIASGAGAKVHIIHHNQRPLKAFPKEYVDNLIQQLESQGVEFHLDIDLKSVESQDQRLKLSDNQNFEQVVDRVFVTAGRKPNDDALNLKNIGVQTDAGGIVVNQYLESTVDNIYAMGDVVSKQIAKLTPVARFEARYLAKRLTGVTKDKIKYPAIPTVVYGMPKLAKVGVELDEAQKYTDRYEIKTAEMTKWFTYSRLQDPFAKVSVIHERDTGKIVGAITISSEAEHLINDLTMLINQGGTKNQIDNQILAYPTEASDLSYM
jgi:glutathione reductase (NADPH)